VNELFRRQRASRGYEVIPLDGAYRRSVQALRENKLLCVLGERNIGEGGIEVDFFGRPTLFPQGPARIALAADAPMIPGFVVRRPDNTFEGIIEPPVPVPRRGGRREKARAMTREYAKLVESYVRRYPAQWGVFFRVWPEDDAEAADEEARLAGGPVWGRGAPGRGVGDEEGDER
jgi:KDO2-lipid IV(A) lauroyltransferase